MRIGIVISTNEAEVVWNAFRFANFSLDKGHTVKVFLIGKGVECGEIEDRKFDVKSQTEKFLEKKGKILACGTCLKSRNKEGSEVCPISSMADLMQIVEESDKIISF